MAATITAPVPVTSGWLRGKTFDLTFVVGVAALGLAAGAALTYRPSLFRPLLVLDLWLLGYHHVVSTFTRLTFDAESFKANKFLVLGLPWIVLAGVALAGYGAGAWLLTTLYFYWQGWHYARQSYGVSRIYQRNAGANDRLADYVIYSTALCGVMFRSSQGPTHFLGAEFWAVPVPGWAAALAGVLAAVLTLVWLARQARAFAERRAPTAHFLYVVTHVAVFAVGYVLIEEINHGWLVVNVWHNAQYILTVWLFNHNRFKGEVDPSHRFLSTLCRRGNFPLYILFCLGVSTAFYLGLSAALGAAAGGATAATFPMLVGAYQVINFHHYVVDAVIWKARKKSVRQNLGVAN
ncbi:MAG TPA: hypothetical protein VN282_20980 [Pyrinomonadaceae bacterium]|nr:hypothetical protein [Pyrinomonadaceae bacterium]